MICIICSPKTVFIMGGGEGSAAREALKHKTIQRVVMCDIDEVPCFPFTDQYLNIIYKSSDGCTYKYIYVRYVHACRRLWTSAEDT